MAISYMSAAATASETPGWKKSNLQLQNTLYLNCLKYLDVQTGKPLISKLFEAWKYGPVIPDLYHRLKISGDKPVNGFFLASKNLGLDEHQTPIEVFNQFADYTPGDLAEITHVSGGAWDRFFASESRGVPIPKRCYVGRAQQGSFLMDSNEEV